MKKRILSVVLSAAMAFVGIAAGVWEPVTVYAEEEESSEPTAESGATFSSIYITSAGALDIGADKESLGIVETADVEYYKVQESGNQLCSGSAADYTFSYSSSSHTLTLNNAMLTAGNESAISSDYTGELIISLIGNNTVTATTGSAIYLNGNTKVTAEGSGSLTAKTTCGLVKPDEESDSLLPAFEGEAGAYFPSAIDLGKNCERFVNDKNTTITAVAEQATSHSNPAFSARRLTCGAPGRTYKDPDDGNTEKSCGRLVNYGIINGKIDLNDGTYDRLVSCDTQYGIPNDGHNYIGKAYYFTDIPIYPNNMIPDEALPEGDWRVVGEYNEDGTPKASKVWYQWIYKDAIGTVKTEDWNHPMQFLVYGDNPEAQLTAEDVAAVDDGGTHIFNNDLYAVWLTNGKVTVNGNVTLDVSCQSAPQEVWNEEQGEMCYDRGENDKVKFVYSPESSVTVTGNTGCFSLNESYRGSANIGGDINFCAFYKDETFLNQKTSDGAIKWIGRWQWQQDNSTDAPEEVYYCAVPKAGQVVSNGDFTDKIKNLALAESGTNVELKGSGLYDGTFFMQTTATKDAEPVAGTSAVINDSSLLVNVSQKNGLENDTYPLVRKTTQAAEQNISSHLSNRANMVAMDIAVIKQTKDAKGDVTAQAKTEPTGTVNLYFDRIDLSKLKNPVLFHIKDNGAVEKLAITKSGSDSASASVKCQTGSFSTYVFAEDQSILYPSSSGGGGWSYGGGSSSSDTTDKTPTETKPDGTKVETSTETKADGTKVDTKVETKADGTKVETVVETAKDGSVKTTETVTQADGSATKTEKESEKNTKGKDVAVTTTTKTDANGKVTGIKQTSEIEKISGSSSATVTVEKTADGKITSAEAELDKKGANSKQGVSATLFGSVVSQITEAAGTQAVEISMTVTAGKKEYTVKADAQDLEAGNKLKVMAINEKTGQHVLVNAKTYTVNKNGNVKLTLPAGMTYQLMDTKEAAVVEKQILATVKVQKTSATVAEGKKITVQMSKKLDMDNVAKITYSTSKKSVATVSKDGQVTAKNTGSVVITAKVTLKNGKTKTVKMKITVK